MNGEWIRAAFTDNRGLKFVSLLIATSLWLFVVGVDHSEMYISVPLELTNLPKEVTVVSRPPGQINVRMSGPRTIMSTISPKKLTVTLDLRGMQAGMNTYEILPSRLGVPQGVDVTDISPSEIRLEADRKVTKRVEVKARTRGTPAEGFAVSRIILTPEQIELTGAERPLRLTQEVFTEVVDVTGLDGSVARDVEITLPDPSFKRADDGSPVHLEVVVEELLVDRQFPSVELLTPAPGWLVRPATVEVRLTGKLQTVSRLTARDVTARPLLADGPQEGLVPVVVTVPEGVEVMQVVPAEVRLSHEKQ